MAQLNFDASTVPPAAAPEVIPAGWYNAQMTASEVKPTADGTGGFLACEFTIISGEHSGRKQFDRINLYNKNPVAVEIAYKTLSAICHAVGVIQVQDSQQLHGKPLQLKVSLRPAGPGADGKMYEASNDVKGYKAIDGASIPMPGAPAGGAPAWAVSGAPAPAAAPAAWAPPAAPAPAAPPAWTPPAAPQPAAPPQWAPPAAAAAPAPGAAAPAPAWTPPAAAAPAAPAPAAPAPAAPAAGVPPPWANQAPGGASPVPPWARPAA